MIFLDSKFQQILESAGWTECKGQRDSIFVVFLICSKRGYLFTKLRVFQFQVSDVRKESHYGGTQISESVGLRLFELVVWVDDVRLWVLKGCNRNYNVGEGGKVVTESLELFGRGIALGNRITEFFGTLHERHTRFLLGGVEMDGPENAQLEWKTCLHVRRVADFELLCIERWQWSQVLGISAAAQQNGMYLWYAPWTTRVRQLKLLCWVRAPIMCTRRNHTSVVGWYQLC